MPDILHRVGIRSTPEKVFAALSTIEGLSYWWTTDTTGDAKLGGTIRFRFDCGGMDMKVVESKLNELVKWKCVDGPTEWIDTELTFQLKPKDDQVFVLFTHAKWKEPVEFMYHCSTKWANFSFEFEGLAGKGQGASYPL